MRYSPEQSEKTRQKVVNIAAAQMRKHGPDKVGVAAVMSRAGLTHGGFYAHFPSKDDLIAAAIDRMFEEASGYFRTWTEGRSRPDALRSYINSYVSKAHRDQPATGCPIAALTSDIHRQGRKARTAFDAGLARLLDAIASLLPGADESAKRALAVSMLSEMTGAVAAARAVSNSQLSDQILSGARRALRARAGLPALPHEGNSR